MLRMSIGSWFRWLLVLFAVYYILLLVVNDEDVYVSYCWLQSLYEKLDISTIKFFCNFPNKRINELTHY